MAAIALLALGAGVVLSGCTPAINEGAGGQGGRSRGGPGVGGSVGSNVGGNVGSNVGGNVGSNVGGNGQCVPTPEVCNGKDDNCDGNIDEGDPGGGEPCVVVPGEGESPPKGECAKGITHCISGAIVCVGNTPSPEICDGLDNNCDGNVDEGNPGGGAACSTGLLGPCAAGTTACVAGSTKCNGTYKPVPEIKCNGIDDDCNGKVDDTSTTCCTKSGCTCC